MVCQEEVTHQNSIGGKLLQQDITDLDHLGLASLAAQTVLLQGACLQCITIPLEDSGHHLRGTGHHFLLRDSHPDATLPLRINLFHVPSLQGDHSIKDSPQGDTLQEEALQNTLQEGTLPEGPLQEGSPQDIPQGNIHLGEIFKEDILQGDIRQKGCHLEEILQAGNPLGDSLREGIHQGGLLLNGILQEGAPMEIPQPGKAILHNPMRDQDSPQANDSLLPQIPIQGVLCLQVTPEKCKTLVHLHLTMMGEGEAGGVIPLQDSGTKRG